MATGFIAKTLQGGIAYGHRVCSLYRFTDELVLEHPKLGIKAMAATNEWQCHTTIAAAHAAARKAHDDAKRIPSDRDSGLQKLKRSSSKNELKAAAVNSDFEVDGALLVQKLK